MSTGLNSSSNVTKDKAATVVSDKSDALPINDVQGALDEVAGKVLLKATPTTDAAAAITKTKSPQISPPLSGEGAAVDNLYFFEDEIYSIDKKGCVKFGLVVETSETYSGDEEDDFDDVLAKGEIRVAWHPDGREEIQLERAVGLADRTIIPADVVRRMLPGKDTQRGYCREINMRADIKIVGTDYVIKNVVAERLRLITNWQRDVAVCLDSWVGSTKGIEEILTLKSCSNGAMFEISSNDLYGFKDVNCRFRRGIFNNPIYYPNQVLTGRLDSTDNITLLTPEISLKTNKKGIPLAGRYIVESIRTKHVWVHWQCKALSEDNGDIKACALQQPEPCVSGEDLQRLKRFNLFESCMLQINDRNYLKLSECDVIIKKSEWDKEQALKFKLLQKQQQQQELSLNMFVGNVASGSTDINSSNTHHFEKLKKKVHLDCDKNVKTKKLDIKNFVIKNKEKSQEVDKQTKDCNNSTNLNDSTLSLSTEGWISEDDDDEDADLNICKNNQNPIDNATIADSEDAQSTTTVSTCSSPTPRSSPKHQSYRWRLNKKQITKTLKKVKGTASVSSEKLPKVGEEIVTEALLVYSTATVVWQDGTIESGIPSTSLYPIHHLDTHEFFPGDFVISGKEDFDVSFRDYGVIQSVDHHGRIARVKWFTTYTSSEEPKPTYKGETEVSVYDLKDHPDFQYRPGIMVIRVANFVGEDATCTAGQIIDNYTDGRVKVWWVDGHISMCWPQDLFEVGQYDQTDLGGNESDDSWETESENSELGCNSPKLLIAESHILSNIERARVAIARLEEIFNISPNLQNQEVMRKLLVVYKGCRYLDRLLNTNFFHEDHFMGLIERVRKGSTQTISERAQDRKNRLFSEAHSTFSSNSKQQPQQQQKQEQQQNCYCQAIVTFNVSKKSNANCSKDYAPKVLFNLSSTPFKCSGSSSTSISGNCNGSTIIHKHKYSPASARDNKTETSQIDTEPTTLYSLLTTHSAPNTSTSEANSVVNSLTPNSSPSRLETSPNKGNSYNAEKNQLLFSAMLNIEKAFEKTSQLKSTLIGASSQDDSGNCDGSSTSYASSSDLTNVDANSSLRSKANDDQKSISCSSIELTDDSTHEFVCVRLCSLLKDQLVKCINEIREKYYKEDNINLSEVFEYDIEEEATETIAEANESAIIISDKESLALRKSITINNDNVEPVVTSKSGSGVESSPNTSACDSLTTVPSSDCFQLLSNAPKTHKFHLTIFHPNNAPQYYKAVQREHRLLKNSLPPGVWVRVFEDRMDLLSVMIEGPKKTPYEDGMFFFDIQLGREYPKSPPLCHYNSYCSDRLNPNLYEDGKVCVSLLGTWTGRDSEVWGSNSTLLQVIVSIQGLILVPEPYFNEAGYEKQKGTQQGNENSRMYNEMVIIKMVQATSKLFQNPPEIFRNEILEHFQLNGMSMFQRIKGWMELSKTIQMSKIDHSEATSIDTPPFAIAELKEEYSLPEFPLVPASKGFCLTLAGLLDTFKSKLAAIITMKFIESFAGDSEDRTD